MFPDELVVIFEPPDSVMDPETLIVPEPRRRLMLSPVIPSLSTRFPPTFSVEDPTLIVCVVPEVHVPDTFPFVVRLPLAMVSVDACALPNARLCIVTADDRVGGFVNGAVPIWAMSVEEGGVEGVP